MSGLDERPKPKTAWCPVCREIILRIDYCGITGKCKVCCSHCIEPHLSMEDKRREWERMIREWFG